MCGDVFSRASFDCLAEDRGFTFITFSACEIDPTVRELLLAHRGTSRSKHVFGDLLERWPQTVVAKGKAVVDTVTAESNRRIQLGDPRDVVLQDANLAVGSSLGSMFSESTMKGCHCFCYRCGKDCPVWDIDQQEVIGHLGLKCIQGLGSGVPGISDANPGAGVHI